MMGTPAPAPPPGPRHRECLCSGRLGCAVYPHPASKQGQRHWDGAGGGSPGGAPHCHGETEAVGRVPPVVMEGCRRQGRMDTPAPAPGKAVGILAPVGVGLLVTPPTRDSMCLACPPCPGTPRSACGPPRWGAGARCRPPPPRPLAVAGRPDFPAFLRPPARPPLAAAGLGSVPPWGRTGGPHPPLCPHGDIAGGAVLCWNGGGGGQRKSTPPITPRKGGGPPIRSQTPELLNYPEREDAQQWVIPTPCWFWGAGGCTPIPSVSPPPPPPPPGMRRGPHRHRHLRPDGPR